MKRGDCYLKGEEREKGRDYLKGEGKGDIYFKGEGRGERDIVTSRGRKGRKGDSYFKGEGRGERE